MDREAWDARYGGADLVLNGEPNPFLVEAATGAAPGRAVDLACGDGRNAIWLARHGWEVTGVDFSAVGLAKAERQVAGEGLNLAWVLHDVVTYLPSPPLDLVVMSFLHLPGEDRRLVLDRSARALGPGGRIFVVGYDLSNANANAAASGVGGRDPELLFTPEQVAEELAGLHIERAERLHLAVETAEGPVEVVDAFVVARRE